MLIKRMAMEQLRQRNLKNLNYIYDKIRRRWRKHYHGHSWDADPISHTGYGMDLNSPQKAYEYSFYLRDIRIVMREKEAAL